MTAGEHECWQRPHRHCLVKATHNALIAAQHCLGLENPAGQLMRRLNKDLSSQEGQFFAAACT